MSLLELFCHVDDFCVRFLPDLHKQLLPDAKPKRNRKRSLHLSEVMTILIWFHRSGYRTFKDFYTRFVLVYWRSEFPGLVSYNRFVEFIPSALLALCAYLKTCLGRPTGYAFADSTPLKVSHPARVHQHKVFAGVAHWGKSSTGWFFGLKLHLTINECGELLCVRISAGNVDDRTPVPDLTKDLVGKLYADKGYVSKPLTRKLLARGLHLVTRLKKRMQNQLMLLSDKLLLFRRGLIDSVIDRLKNGCQIEHSRHRSVTNAFVHLIAGLVAYCHLPQKPSLQSLLPGIMAH
jgi:hypothetical protein